MSKADEAISYLLKAYIDGDGVDTDGYGAWPWTIPINPDYTILLTYIAVPMLAGGIGTYASWKIYHERDRRLGGY